MTTVNLPTVQPVEALEEMWGRSLTPAGCSVCRQAHLVEQGQVGRSCPACTQGKLAPQPALLRSEPPEMALPFRRKRADLGVIYKSFTDGVWLHSDDFTPESLLQRATPVFLPMWLVDSLLTGSWQAEVGYDYEVKSSQESYGSSGWQTRSVIEKRIRWEPRLGQIQRQYHNVPAPAMSNHDHMMRLAGSYPLEQGEPYRPSFLQTEFGPAALRVPDLQPESAWPLAESSLKQAAARECIQAAQAQHERNFSVRASFDNLVWTQMLLPVYVSYYTDDENQPQLVYVNGVTGAAGGLRLASQRKGWQWAGILAAIAAVLFVLGLISFGTAVLFPPLSAVGVLFILAAFGVGVAAVVPAAWPWQWNRGQQLQKIVKK